MRLGGPEAIAATPAFVSSRPSATTWPSFKDDKFAVRNLELLVSLTDKYTDMLGISGERPEIEIHNNLGSKWLGRCVFNINRPTTTLIELQAKLFEDPRTLERVFAHEMCHHREALLLSPNDIARIARGYRQVLHHGDVFWEGSRIVNSVMGADFTIRTSDKNFVYAKNEKKFYVLIGPVPRKERSYEWIKQGVVVVRDLEENTIDDLCWAWATRLTPQISEQIEIVKAKGGRLVMTSDERWANGPKIRLHGGMAVLHRDEQDLISALHRLFEEAES